MSSRTSTPEPCNPVRPPRPTVEDDISDFELSGRNAEDQALPPPYSPSTPSPTHDMPFNIASLLNEEVDFHSAPKIYLRADSHVMENGGTLGSVVLVVESFQRDNALTFFLPTIRNPERIPPTLPRGWMDIVHGPRGAAIGLVRTQRYLLLELFAIFHAYATRLADLDRAHFSAFSQRLFDAAESLHPFERADRVLRRIADWARTVLPRAVYEDPIIPFATTTASVFDLDAVSFAVERVLFSSRAQWLRAMPARARPVWVRAHWLAALNNQAYLAPSERHPILARVGDDGDDYDDMPELESIE